MPLNANAIFPAEDPEFTQFPSRRSVVHSTKGIVASTQPLACEAGQRILKQGGNAADAAVAVAAALNMTEPSMTGIGGDMFCLFYKATDKKVYALNGSGRAGGKVTLDRIRNDLGIKDGQAGEIPMTGPGSVHSVTVPGAAAGWVDTVERFGSGKLSLSQILEPAIQLGEEGYPVSELSAHLWQRSEQKIRDASPNFAEMLKSASSAPGGVRAPKAGEIFRNPTLAQTFRTLATEGKLAFYTGRIGQELVKVVQDLGGYLELADLEQHANLGSGSPDPICLHFKGQKVGDLPSTHVNGEAGYEGVKPWEHPPNGQGIVALMALGILQELEKAGKIPYFSSISDHNSASYLHAIIEALRIAFSDAAWFVTDPDVEDVPSQSLISPSYLAERSKLFSPDHAMPSPQHGEPSPAHRSSDTVYFSVTDSEGNGCSFIISNYGGFGTCIIPRGCGFTLQNRGANFSLKSGHPNVLAPSKRPYHTIIPAMITNAHDNSLHTVYGVMGGFMQPQGHVQVLLNMLVFHMTPQAALDAPRICIGAGTPDEGETGVDSIVYLEEGISQDTVKGLEALGHKVEVLTGLERGMFGRGQVIRCHVDEETGKTVYSAGSDMRGDGMAMPV